MQTAASNGRKRALSSTEISLTNSKRPLLEMENFSALPPKNGLSNKDLTGGGAKKLVIKNLKVKPSLPDNFQTKAVDKLRNAVVAIQTASPIDASLEELYQAVEALCSHGLGEEVYTHLKVINRISFILVEASKNWVLCAEKLRGKMETLNSSFLKFNIFFSY
jgi:hypothetical protein